MCARIRRSSASRTRPRRHTISYSTSGSTTHNIVLGLRQGARHQGDTDLDRRPAGDLDAVMSGQIDIGWAAPPFGLQGDRGGQDPPRSPAATTCRRCAARPSGSRSSMPTCSRTARMPSCASCAPSARRSTGCMPIPEAIRMYAEPSRCRWRSPRPRSRNISRRRPCSSIAFSTSKASWRTRSGYKFLDVPLTKEQLAEFIQIPPR